MNTELIQHRIRTLNDLIVHLDQHLSHAPEGSLKISHRKGRPQYYRADPADRRHCKYLGRQEYDTVLKLARKSYYRKVLNSARQELDAWETLLSLLPVILCEDIYAGLSDDRQALVEPIVLTDEEFRRRWEAVPYEPGWFKDGSAVYITDRGERVRSKSEQLIANLLYRLDIPYRYEYPVEINEDGRRRVWRPDFMILDVKHRKEFFLEHLGMMDDETYARRNQHKMRVYEDNGLFEGSGMYYSIETSGAPIDIVMVERKIRRILSQPGGGLPENIHKLPYWNL